MSDSYRGTCDICKRVRKLHRSGDGYRMWCEECRSLTAEEREEEAKRGRERSKARTRAKKKAYPCIGGPLDGEHAMIEDFDRQYGKPGDPWYSERGMYAHLASEYEAYNASGNNGPSMIFVHVGVLQPVRPGRER